MDPIELGKAISEYGISIITAVMLILVVGLIWYLIKRQTKREDKRDIQQDEDRKFHRDLITNHLKGIHEMSLKNKELSIQGITLQKEMIKDLKDHNGDSQKAWRKINESLSAVCDKLNDKKVSKKNGQKK